MSEPKDNGSRQVLLDAFEWMISDIERESSSGIVVQVLGPIVDVEFRGELPAIGNLHAGRRP